MTVQVSSCPRTLPSGIVPAGLAVYALMLAVVVPAAAQAVTATTGAVNGIVTDNTGAIVPGYARVTCRC